MLQEGKPKKRLIKKNGMTFQNTFVKIHQNFSKRFEISKL
jgi:hypothetical protein